MSGRPLLNFTFAINYALDGLEVRGYHAGNVLIHILAGLVLFGILRRTLQRLAWPAASARWFALTVALWWALHPLQTGAVTYIVQRAESLASLFYLLTLYCFIRSTEPHAAQTRWQVGSVVACLLGLLTKEIVATAPVLVLLYDRAFVSGSFQKAWRNHRWQHVALAACWAPLAFLVAGNESRGGSAGPGSTLDSWTYLLTQGDAIVRYLRLSLWPAPQIFDYGTATVAGIGAVLPHLLLLAAAFAASCRALWRNHAVGFLGVSFFLLLAPSSSIVPVATQTIAEHRMYLALAPLLVLLCAVFHRLLQPRRRWLAVALSAGIATSLGAATYARNEVYRSALALWQDTAAKRPENPRAHNNLGAYLLAAGRFEEATSAFRQALALQPNHAFAHFNLATALLALERTAESVGHFEAALAADPRYVSAHVNLGDALVRLGRDDEAMTHYQAALALEPSAHDARTNLASLLIRRNRLEEAQLMLRDIPAIYSRATEAHFALGNAWVKQRRLADAIEAFQRAVALDSNHVEARNNLGNCQLVTGRLREAITTYEAVLERRLGDKTVQQNLEVARELLYRSPPRR